MNSWGFVFAWATLICFLRFGKNELILWIKLSQTQRTLYKAFLESEEVKSIFNSSRSPLAALTVLKKVCDHPRLLTEEMKMCKALMLEKYRLSSVLEVWNFFSCVTFCHFQPVFFIRRGHTAERIQQVVDNDQGPYWPPSRRPSNLDFQPKQKDAGHYRDCSWTFGKPSLTCPWFSFMPTFV